MAAALAQLSARLGQAGLPDPRRESRVAQLFASIGLEALECSVSADVTGHITASITVARTAFAADELRALTDEMSRICRRDFALPEVAHCRTVTMLTFTERPLFDVQFGSASRPAEEVSGDACDQFCDSCGRAQMILCDGMGTGRPAAVDGQLAARLTGQLLRAGFAAESAARLVNVAMGLKNGEQESGATLDLLTVDLFTGRAGLFKAGAAPSFLVRGGDPRMMEGASLPMGIWMRWWGAPPALRWTPATWWCWCPTGCCATAPTGSCSSCSCPPGWGTARPSWPTRWRTRPCGGPASGGTTSPWQC